MWLSIKIAKESYYNSFLCTPKEHWNSNIIEFHFFMHPNKLHFSYIAELKIKNLYIIKIQLIVIQVFLGFM